MDISGRRTREPTVRSLAMQQLLSSPRTVSTVSTVCTVSSLTDTEVLPTLTLFSEIEMIIPFKLKLWCQKM